jgi:hypothetical protein
MFEPRHNNRRSRELSSTRDLTVQQPDTRDGHCTLTFLAGDGSSALTICAAAAFCLGVVFDGDTTSSSSDKLDSASLSLCTRQVACSAKPPDFRSSSPRGSMIADRHFAHLVVLGLPLPPATGRLPTA